MKPSKKNDLKHQILVLAPHEGIVPSDIWLTCRKKLMNNMKIHSARKATHHTWMAEKIKCGNCGYSLMSINNPVGKQYLHCTKRLDNKSCAGCGKIITSDLEAVVYRQIVKNRQAARRCQAERKRQRQTNCLPANGACPCGQRD